MPNKRTRISSTKGGMWIKNVWAYLKFTTLLFHLQSRAARNANVSLAIFVFRVIWSKIQDFGLFSSALLRIVGTHSTMLPFIVTRTATRRNKRHRGALADRDKKTIYNYLQLRSDVYKFKRVLTPPKGKNTVKLRLTRECNMSSQLRKCCVAK